MTNTTINNKELSRIINYNHQIRRIVQIATNNLLSIEDELLKHIEDENFDRTIQKKFQSLIDLLEVRLLNRQVITERVQLAFVGENACGKTSLIHFLLDSCPFLPSDVGPVSARIIHLTYADSLEACLCIYQSLENRNQEPVEKICLKDYFTKSTPDWNNIKLVIQPYIKRPEQDKIGKNSQEFIDWAKYFVELRIPSEFLKLGIDLYDTPGLLYSDPPILKQNLQNLVKLIRPTVVFMYDNPSISAHTQESFSALKEALGQQLEDINIFFLNTKVDIGSILSSDDDITMEYFENEFLFKIRQERKDLLMKIPTMAQEIKRGSEFNIISVDSDWNLLGSKMNVLTINHIIEFVTNTDLCAAKAIKQVLLPIINSFFDFVFITHHLTHEQLHELRRNAHEWADKYFIEHKKYLDKFLNILYDEIIKALDDTMSSIKQRAINEKNEENIKEYIRSFIQYQIIQVIVNGCIREYGKIPTVQRNFDLSTINRADRNELLLSAQRNFVIRLFNIDDTASYQYYMYDKLIESLFFIGDLLIETDDEDEESSFKVHYESSKEIKMKLQQILMKKTNPSTIEDPLNVAQKYLDDIRLSISEQKIYLNLIIEEWCKCRNNELKDNIEQQYILTKRFSSKKEKASYWANQYVGPFACIECQLNIADNLMNSNGHSPIIDFTQSMFTDGNTFCEFYSAKWFDENDCIVKKLKNNISNAQYLEAHYHRQVSQLDDLHVLKLVYLYENDVNELFMFFPKYQSVENDVDELTMTNVFSIMLTVAESLEKMHNNELVHGNVNLENIFQNENGEYLLGDLFSKESYGSLDEYINRHQPNKKLLAFTDDSFSFGKLGLFLYHTAKAAVNYNTNALKQWKHLLEKCSHKEPMARPKLSDVVKKMKDLSTAFRLT